MHVGQCTYPPITACLLRRQRDFVLNRAVTMGMQCDCGLKTMEPPSQARLLHLQLDAQRDVDLGQLLRHSRQHLLVDILVVCFRRPRRRSRRCLARSLSHHPCCLPQPEPSLRLLLKSHQPLDSFVEELAIALRWQPNAGALRTPFWATHGACRSSQPMTWSSAPLTYTSVAALAAYAGRALLQCTTKTASSGNSTYCAAQASMRRPTSTPSKASTTLRTSPACGAEAACARAYAPARCSACLHAFFLLKEPELPTCSPALVHVAWHQQSLE